MIFLLSIVVLLLWLIRNRWRMRRIWKLDRILRSKYRAWPIVGHGLMFLGSATDRMETLKKFAREAIKNKYGMTAGWLGSQLCIVTSDPIVAEKISKICLEKTEELINAARHIAGNAAAFAPVNIWRPRRKVLASAFSTKNLRGYVKIFAEESMTLVECLSTKAGQSAFPIWQNCTTYTMDSIFRSTFGFSIQTQKQPLNPFLVALNRYLHIAPIRLIQPSPRLEWLFNLLPIFKEAEELKKTVHSFIDEVVSKRRIVIEEKINSHKQISFDSEYPKSHTLFMEQFLISSASNNGIPYTNEELKEEILFILGAGNDTTAVGTAFTFTMLSRHLDVQEKAYQEVLNVFGDSKRPATEEDLPKLKYVEAVIKESLRLYPSVPSIIREIDVDLELDSEITLPAGTYAAINIWGLHRNPRYWGDDAEEFNPDRFLKEPLTHQAAFMPFSYGPRNCPGYRYAMLSMKVVVSTMLRHYKLLPSAEDLGKPIQLEYCIMMKDVDNYKVRLEHRV